MLDRAGRLQLPRAHVEALELRNRVRLRLEEDHVGVWPDLGDRSREPGRAGPGAAAVDAGHPGGAPMTERYARPGPGARGDGGRLRPGPRLRERRRRRPCAARHRPARRARRAPGRARTVRERQDDAPQPARRPRPAHVGHGDRGRHGGLGARRGRVGGRPPPDRRLRVPDVRADPDPDRGRERRGPAAARRRGAARARPPGHGAAGPGGPRARGRSIGRTSSPAASSSGSRSRAPSPTGPGSCSPTSRPGSWTPRRAGGSCC